MAANGSMIRAIGTVVFCLALSGVAAPPAHASDTSSGITPPKPVRAGSAATPRVHPTGTRANVTGTRAVVGTTRANITGTRANITGSRDVGHTSLPVRAKPTPDVEIGAAVGSRGHHHYHGHHGYHGHRYYGYRGFIQTSVYYRYGAEVSLPYTGRVRQECDWISVPVYGRTGGITHHAYYWHPAVVPPIAETARRVDPELMNEAPEVEGGEGAFRIEDKALEAMRSGDYKRAALLYQQRWMEIVDAELGMDEGTQRAADRDLVVGALGQSHAEVLRLRAIALVGAGRHDDAARELARAYRLEPTLAVRAVLGRELVGDAYRLRRLVNSSVRHAHRADTGEAWVVVAMLMQAEGREQVARRMLNRARELERLDPIGSGQTDDEDGERPLSIFRE